MNAATDSLRKIDSHLKQRAERLGWTLARMPSGRFMVAKGTTSLHFQDRQGLESWLATAKGQVPQALGLDALVTRLAAVGLQGRHRANRGSIAVRDTDGTPLFETRSAARVERLLAQRGEAAS